jgi:uncharacterized membrane protein
MAPARKLWLDWQRGLAVLFMVEVHTVDAWLAPGAGRSFVREALMMVGGFAAPSFLFLAGLSQVLADAALARRGAPPRDRLATALGRGATLLAIAYAFRALEFALGGAFLVDGGWADILRVDILNVIAVGLILAAPLTACAPPRWHVALAAAGACAVVLATPPAAAWAHPPSRALDYLYATWPRANFSLLNWSAFLLAGGAVGRLVAARDRPRLLLALGAALAAAGAAADLGPALYAHQDFWHTSPSWFALRLGAVVALTGALQLVPARADAALGWLRTLGRHSLLGYAASVELTYGLASRPLHRALSLGTSLAGIAAMIGVTWALAAAADHLSARRRRPAAPSRGAIAS